MPGDLGAARQAAQIRHRQRQGMVHQPVDLQPPIGEMLGGMAAMLAAGQTRENELDLPATLARIQPPVR